MNRRNFLRAAAGMTVVLPILPFLQSEPTPVTRVVPDLAGLMSVEDVYKMYGLDDPLGQVWSSSVWQYG